VSFDVSAEAYGRFMGRYSDRLAAEFLAAACVDAGANALDVGCGPGALTAALVARLGSAAVSAVEPSEPFVEAARARLPGVDIRRCSAEALPFADDSFDLAMAQLVVHFMADPIAGIAEMARVTRRDGLVAACVWDYFGDRAPLSDFWLALHDLDPAATGESGLPGAREGHLVALFEEAGLRRVEPVTLTVRVSYPSFADWWEPYTLGVGPAGDYVAGLDAGAREELRAHCAERLPPGAFDIEASAWTALGRV
jgi:SAM-dependent methyltransferase